MRAMFMISTTRILPFIRKIFMNFTNMRSFIMLCLFMIAPHLKAQDAPVWSYIIQRPSLYFSNDISGNGDLFALFRMTDTANCNTYFAYTISLGPGGNLVWDNAFDTTNFCTEENPWNCSVISGLSPDHLVASTLKDYNPSDSACLVTYTSGNETARTINGNFQCVVGDMEDGFAYFSLARPASISKMNPTGNLVWTWTGGDSMAVQATHFNPGLRRILAANEDYSSSASDDITRIYGVDTSGVEQFNVAANLFPGENEYPRDIWFSPGRFIFGVSTSVTSGSLAFAMDTTIGTMWTIPFSNYLDAAYDPVNHVIHYLARQGTSGTVLVSYKINAASGFVTDSLVIDSVVTSRANLGLDSLGNLYVGYRRAFSAVPAYRIDRYSPNYYYDWTGEHIDPAAASLGSLDISVSDSGFAYLFYSVVGYSTICKFAPPVVSGTLDIAPAQSQFSIFPNPASGDISYSISANIHPLTYQITTLTGNIIATGKCSLSGRGKIDLSSLPASVYFISILDEKDNLIAAPKKIIKL